MLEEFKMMVGADLEFAFSELAVTAQINDQAGVPCITTPWTRGRASDLIGDMPTASMSMYVRTTGHARDPVPGDPVVFKGRNYRIADIQRNQDEQLMVLILMDING